MYTINQIENNLPLKRDGLGKSMQNLQVIHNILFPLKWVGGM